MIARFTVKEEHARYLVADLLSEGDRVVLVVPIDSAAPKGRLILPQQQTIRRSSMPVLRLLSRGKRNFRGHSLLLEGPKACDHRLPGVLCR